MRIATTEPIINVTFSIPLPVKNGVPKVGEYLISKGDFGYTGYFINFTDSPPGLNLEGAYPVPDNRPLFACIRTDAMRGNISYYIPNTSYLVDIDKIENHDNPRLFFNTLYPIGNESVLLPKFDFALPSPVEDRGKYLRYLIGYKSVWIRQSIPVYADYNATPTYRSTSISICTMDGDRGVLLMQIPMRILCTGEPGGSPMDGSVPAENFIRAGGCTQIIPIRPGRIP
jgi:hypothetical protein